MAHNSRNRSRNRIEETPPPHQNQLLLRHRRITSTPPPVPSFSSWILDQPSESHLTQPLLPLTSRVTGSANRAYNEPSSSRAAAPSSSHIINVDFNGERAHVNQSAENQVGANEQSTRVYPQNDGARDSSVPPVANASADQIHNLENAERERTEIYKDKNEYNEKYIASMTFFVVCIATFGSFITFVSYFGRIKSKKYFAIDLLCLLGTFLFGFMGAALITYSHIRDLEWGAISIRRRIFNLKDKVNTAPSTAALPIDIYEARISELKSTLEVEDEWEFGMLAFKFFCISGCFFILWLICWGSYDGPGGSNSNNLG